MNAELANNWIPDASFFGARLALVRWRMGWNVKQAADECQLSPTSWANWEAGREPRKYMATIAAIVLRTGVDRIWLMTGEGSPEPQGRTSD